ncbi:GtrA family protein [Halobacillus mangrovi]|uniref:Teichoic acid glycosylation protein n=1 Tax=Halobacillus mangrovi TaxID=402384 RepID=A0A1W5ZSA3_9BACI|nr:GtrA family protein [Halobacillus mangrovi]ARI76186.1 teichoic acid glycosylation protein [Halobacillus mangrovi]
MNKHSKQMEVLLYLVFGGLTTLVNIVTYYVAANLIGMDYKLATTIAWLVAVLFAFFTNKAYVFKSEQSAWKELFPFMGARLLSYFLDIGTMIVLVDLIHVDDLISKIAANVLVVLFNYVASKYFIFNDQTVEKEEQANDRVQ